MDDFLVMWVVYYRPADYPNHYVVRRWRIKNWQVIPFEVAGLYDSLREARMDIPLGLARINRHPSDVLALVESWI